MAYTEEAKQRGRKIEAGILRFCRENGLDLDSDGGLVGWQNALVLNEIEIYTPDVEFDLEGFLSSVWFQSGFMYDLGCDASLFLHWKTEKNGGKWASGIFENEECLIPEWVFAFPDEKQRGFVFYNGAAALENALKRLDRKRFLWSLTLHFWKQTAKTGAESEPIEQTGQEETRSRSLAESSAFTWRDVRIVFESDSKLRLEIAGKQAQRFSFEGAGFMNKKTNGPLKAWDTLLDLADMEQVRKPSRKNANNFAMEISRIRKKLETLVGLEDCPILYDPKMEIYYVEKMRLERRHGGGDNQERSEVAEMFSDRSRGIAQSKKTAGDDDLITD